MTREEESPTRKRGCSIVARVLVAMIGAGAVACSIYTSLSCDFFSYQSLDGTPWEGLSPPFDTSSHSSVGFFTYSSLSSNDEQQQLFGEECTRYDDWADVGQHVFFYVSQWCSLAAPVVGFVAWAANLGEIFCCKFFGSSFLVSILFLLATFLQFGTFLIFGDQDFCLEAASQNECYFGIGAWSSLASGAAYLVVFVAVCLSRRQTPIYRNRCIKQNIPIEDRWDEIDGEKSEDDTVEQTDLEQDSQRVSSAENEDLTVDSAIHNMEVPQNSTVDTEPPRDETTPRNENLRKETTPRDPPERKAEDNDDAETMVSNDDETNMNTKSVMSSTVFSDEGYDTETAFTYDKSMDPLEEIIDAANPWAKKRDGDLLDLCCADPFQHVESMKIQSPAPRAKYPLSRGKSFQNRVHFGP